MRVTVVSALFTLAALALPGKAVAENPAFLNGLKLLGACDNSYTQDFCMSYIMGVHDQNVILQGWRSPNPLGSYCLPDTGDSGQLVATVRRYLHDNPAELHYGAPTLVVMALVEAFPCVR